MTLPAYMLEPLLQAQQNRAERELAPVQERRPNAPKRGEEIFAGTDYPKAWAGFIGQTQAKEQLMVQVASARARGNRIEHTLLASGTPGVGKSTLATMLAYHAEAGFVQASGSIDVDKAGELLQSMEDGDILFIDEVHTMVAGSRAKAEWLLPFMTEGRLYTPSGPVECPNVAIVAATTDAGKLPETIISRFMVKPKLVAYTDDEATQIASNLAIRMKVSDSVPNGSDGMRAVALAASGNPRDMRSILIAVRDLALAFPHQSVDLDKAFNWAGFSRDGLSQLAREMLVLLYNQPGRIASIESIQAMLGEPGPLKHHEQVLLRRGLLTITGRGRQLTDQGMFRAIDVVQNGEL